MAAQLAPIYKVDQRVGWLEDETTNQTRNGVNLRATYPARRLSLF